jgi:hypothetical protein
MKIWKTEWEQIEHAYLSGTKAMNGALADATVVDNGDGTVGIPITAHGLSANNYVLIAGTTNYNGVHKIVSVDTNVINITATYVAETVASSDTYKTCFQNPYNNEFQIMEVRLTLSAAGGAAEAYYIKIDHEEGAAWDAILDSIADTTSTVSDIWKAWEERRYCNDGDIIYFEYANTNSRTWGIEIIYRPWA